jgi:rhamnulokinase
MNEPSTTKCLAVDMGASNIRIMLGTVCDDALAYKEIYRFANTIVEKDGHERWDIEHILHEIIKGLNQANAESGEGIASIGVDAWGVDFTMLDASGNLMELPVAYRDKRTEGMEKKWLGMMSREETFQHSGINFYIFNTLFQILSMKGSEKLDATSRILFLPCYVLSKLGGKAVNELTISSTSQLLNASSGKWDPAILEHLGISPDILGQVCAPGTILGEVDHPELEMPGTQTIAVCAHDTASAVVSVPFGDETPVFISTGTWCLLGIESDQPILSRDALEEGFTNERGYGGRYRCLKNIVGLWLVQELMKSLPVKDDYDEIESLARKSDKNLNIINPDDPLFYNPDNMKEAFDEYFRRTRQELPSEPGGYFRCAYDSLIYSFLYHIEKIEKMTGLTIETIHLIGGGCQSGYLTSQTTSICRRKVVSGPVEAATIGNILVQAMALGLVPDLRAGHTLVKNSMAVHTFYPDHPELDHGSSYRKYLELKREGEIE